MTGPRRVWNQKFAIGVNKGGYPGAFAGAVSVTLESRPASAGLNATNPIPNAGEFDSSVKLSVPGVGFTNIGFSKSDWMSSPCACHCLNVSHVMGGCCPPFAGKYGVLKNGSAVSPPVAFLSKYR